MIIQVPAELINDGLPKGHFGISTLTMIEVRESKWIAPFRWPTYEHCIIRYGISILIQNLWHITSHLDGSTE